MSISNENIQRTSEIATMPPPIRARRWLAWLASPRQGGLAALLLTVLLAPLFLDGAYHYELAILVGINATAVIGLNLLVGYAGQISLGHAAFFSLGSYASAILTGRYGWPAPLALAAAVALVGAIAFGIARPILRLTGHYLAMATLGLGMIIYLMISIESWLTGGPDGMSVPPLQVFGLSLTEQAYWYWLIGAILVAAYWLALNLIDSPVGRALRAVHGSEISATTAGVDVTSYKVRVFSLSAVVAAFMGGLYAFYSGFISPTTASFMHSIEFVVMVVLGGLASVMGSVVGALILTLLPQLLTVVADYEWLAYGAVLMLVMIFMPKGLVPTLHDWLRRLAR